MNSTAQLPVTTILLTLAILIALSGLWLATRGVFHCCRLHAIKGSCQLGCGALLIMASLLVLAGGINLASYARLSHEQPVARLHFFEITPQKYLVAVHFSDDHRQQEFELIGDEWQLDAKVMKWHSYANLLGFDAHYKLTRLSGRFQDLQQARQTPPSLYALSAEPGFDLWHFIRRYPGLLPLVDAYYGSAVYLPMSDQAQFDVFMTQSGLIARPVNAVDRDRLRHW